MGASAGTKIAAWIPASRAAQATACPWLPALAATTPARCSASPSVEILLKAPRILNEPVRCRFSALSTTSRPARRENVSERNTGVTRATPSRRPRAASMSRRPGAVSVANVENLVEDLVHRRQRIELAALDGVDNASQLRIVGDRPLEVRLRPRRGDGEHLLRQIPATALLEQPVAFEKRPVRDDLLPAAVEVLAS